jgi:hypothetical protein
MINFSRRDVLAGITMTAANLLFHREMLDQNVLAVGKRMEKKGWSAR